MIQFDLPSWKANNLLTCRLHHKLLEIINWVNVGKHIQINFWWVVFVLDRKSVRQSTTEHTRLTYLRLQERQVAPRRRKGTRHERPLTQAELLAEAKVTAEINLRSLGEELITDTFANCSVCETWMLIAVCDFFAENYERLEADKKRQVHMKRQCVGSVIRYHSVLMPLVSDVTLKEENVDVEGYFYWFLISFGFWLFLRLRRSLS